MFGSAHGLRTAAIVASAGLALLPAACGGSSKVDDLSSTSADALVKTATRTGTSLEQAQLEDAYLRFARCMRSHGIGDFPDPVTGSGGHPGFRLQGGSSSDLSSTDPDFRRGVEKCQRLLGHRFTFDFAPSGAGKGA
jgi:hypothetical protein